MTNHIYYCKLQYMIVHNRLHTEEMYDSEKSFNSQTDRQTITRILCCQQWKQLFPRITLIDRCMDGTERRTGPAIFMSTFMTAFSLGWIVDDKGQSFSISGSLITHLKMSLRLSFTWMWWRILCGQKYAYLVDTFHLERRTVGTVDCYEGVKCSRSILKHILIQ